MKLLAKTMIGGLLAIAMVFTLTPLVGGYSYANGEDDDSDPLELRAVVFDGDAEYDWAHYYSVNSKSDDPTLDLKELNITVLDDQGEDVDSDYYDLTIERIYYDEWGTEQYTDSLDLPIGVHADDAEQGYTEYLVSVEATDEGPYYGEAIGRFYIMDKYSLNWICADVDFSDLNDMGDWHMMSYWKGNLSNLPEYPVVKDCTGDGLTIGDDYQVTYYEAVDKWETDPRDFVDEEYALDGQPQNPGTYVACIEGQEPYYGKCEVLLELGTFIYFNPEDDGALWSDETKKIALDIPEIDQGELGLKVGFRSMASGEWSSELSEKDGDYSFDREDNTLTLDGAAILENYPYYFQDENSDDRICIYACIKNGEDVLADGELFVPDKRRAEIEDELEQSEADKTMIPGEAEYIQDSYYVKVQNSKYPEGEYYYNTVKDVEIIDEQPDEEGKNVLSWRESDSPDSDSFGFYKAENTGTATIQITYDSEMDGSENNQHTFTVTVAEARYEAKVWPQNGHQTGLPGSTITLNASAVKHYLVENEEDPDVWDEKETSDGLVFNWSIDSDNEGVDGNEYATVEVDESDSSVAVLKFKDSESLSEDWGGYASIIVNVTVTDSNAKDPEAVVANDGYSFSIANDYYQIEPAMIDPELDVSASVTIEPKVYHYVAGSEEPTLVPAERVEFDWGYYYGVDISNGDDPGSYVITRQSGESLSFDLYASIYDDPGESTDPTDPTDPTEPTEPTEPTTISIYQSYYLNPKDYSFSLDTDGSDSVFSDGTLKVSIDPAKDYEGFTYEYTVGIMDYETGDLVTTFDEGTHYTVADDGKSITLNGEALFAAGNGEDFYINVHAELKAGDELLYSNGEDINVREAQIRYSMEDDIELFPGDDQFIAASADGYIINTEHPEGDEFSYDVISAEIKSQEPKEAGKNVITLEPSNDTDEGSGWTIKAVSYGTAVIEITYADLSGEEQTYTFEVAVVGDRYWVNLDFADGYSSRVLPNGEVKLVANGRHEKDDGSVITEGLSYRWRVDEEVAAFVTVTPDDQDSSKATVTFHDIDQLTDDDLLDDFDVFVDLYDEGDDPKDTVSVSISVTDSYVEIWPTRIEYPDEIGETFDVGETIEVTPEVREYSVDNEDSYRVLDDVLQGDEAIEYEWTFDEYSEEGAFEISEKEGEAGTFLIKRLKKGWASLQLTAKSSYFDQYYPDGAYPEAYYSIDSIDDFEISFEEDEYTVARNGQVEVVLDVSELENLEDYDLQFEVGYYDNDDAWQPIDNATSFYTVADNVVTIDGAALAEALAGTDLTGVYIRAKLIVDGEELGNTECGVALEEQEECEHEMTPHEAVEPTCVDAGNSAYWSCSKCERFFADENGETEIDENSWIIEATGEHTWNDGEVTVPPTCKEPGEKTYECTVCHQTKTEPVEIDPDAHNWSEIGYEWANDYSTVTAKRVCMIDPSHVEEETVNTTCEETASTCTENGVKKYTSAAFENPAFEVQTTNVAIEELAAHTPGDRVKVVTVPATCTTEGSEAFVTYCSVCGAELERGEATPISKLGHKEPLIHVEAKEANCTESGNHEYWYCEQCQGYFKDANAETQYDESSWIIPAKNHTLVKVDKVAPTTTKEGTEAYWKCSVCGKMFSDAGGKNQITAPVKIAKLPDPAQQKGADGTALGKGASAQAAEKAITSMKNDNDPAGSAFSVLQLKSTKQAKTSITLNWTKAKGAVKYVVYGNMCGKANKMKKIATAKSNKYVVKKAVKKLVKGKNYKFIVVALDKNNKVVSTSKLIHVATAGTKVGNYKSVTVTKKVIKAAAKLKKGKTLKLAAKAVPVAKKKVAKHCAVRYESTNKKIATVSAKGVVKGVKKGTCYVYAYAQNGVAKKIKVVVK